MQIIIMQSENHHLSAEDIEKQISFFKQSPKDFNNIFHSLLPKEDYCFHYLSSNLSYIQKQLKSISLSSNHDVYRVYSSIFGAFLRDSMGSFCEFTRYSQFNYKDIFNGKNVFGLPPGQVTDDSEMALSMAYAMMDSVNPKELDQDLIYYYYGAWMKSGPFDIGRTKMNALRDFNFEHYFIDTKDKVKETLQRLEKENRDSLSNGFLMRISPFVAWFYYRNKQFIIDVFKSKKENEYVALYEKIKDTVILDNKLTHTNPEVFSASGVFVFMALSAMCDYTPKEILAQVSVLISQDIFKEEYECNVKEIIKGYLEMFGKKDFDKETFFRLVSEKSIGYYVQGMKLTLFFCISTMKLMKVNLLNIAR